MSFTNIWFLGSMGIIVIGTIITIAIIQYRRFQKGKVTYKTDKKNFKAAKKEVAALYLDEIKDYKKMGKKHIAIQLAVISMDDKGEELVMKIDDFIKEFDTFDKVSGAKKLKYVNSNMQEISDSDLIDDPTVIQSYY